MGKQLGASKATSDAAKRERDSAAKEGKTRATRLVRKSIKLAIRHCSNDFLEASSSHYHRRNHASFF